MTRCSSIRLRSLRYCLRCGGGACCCHCRKCKTRLLLSPAADLGRAAARLALCVCVAACLAYGSLRSTANDLPPELRREALTAANQPHTLHGDDKSPLLDPRAAANSAMSLQLSGARRLACLQPLSLFRCLSENGKPISNATVSSATECPDRSAPSSSWQANSTTELQQKLQSQSRGNGSATEHRKYFAEFSFVGCLSQPPSRQWQRRTRRPKSMTVERCVVDCYDAGFNYALLTRGDTCLCLMSAAEATSIAHRDDCMQPCAGNALFACGGAQAASVYHLRSSDGGHDWSPWMSPPWRTPGSVHATRFRRCLLPLQPREQAETVSPRPPLRECQANLERRWDRSAPTPPAFDRFVGCFVFGSWPRVVAERQFEGTTAGDPQTCVAFCAQVGGGASGTVAHYNYALYAAAKRRCLCANTLGIAQPFGHCDGSYASAAGAYFTTPPAVATDRRRGGGSAGGSSVRLLFDPLPRAPRVHLLAYFRSGSTFTSELLGRHPGALYLYEPDAAHGLTWPDADNSSAAAAKATSQVHEDFYLALGRYMSCDVYRLPPRWLTLNTRWPHDLELTPRYADYSACTRAHGSDACAAAFRAHCEAASLVAAKTIRVGSAQHAERFAKLRPDIALLHLTRDPRGVLASRKHLHVALTSHRVRQLCGRLASLGAVADRLSALGYSVHNLRYEDAALAPVKTAKLVLERYLGLELSASLVERLLVITGHLDPPAAGGDSEVALQEFGTLRRNSHNPLYKWKRSLTAAELRLIALHCSGVISKRPAANTRHK